ncbi:uncharacterized protein LOC126832877 [Adelges cooleyi]|uniref:uncharacterized protein LOC126832877 n=1 Tax=Adelges cooleyi TaxID=133065 RepID=UPI00217FC9D4|nr:uncharacterized protein LOC126832877 [Adelges cooleyi]
MKFLYILISFAWVNVSVALDDYLKQVILLNQQMRNDSKAELARVIQSVVLFGGFSMVELALIFAVPDAEDDVISNLTSEKHIMQPKKFYQEIWQEKIWFYQLPGASDINEAEYENATLRDLGNDRRKITMQAIKLLILDIIVGPNTNFESFSVMCVLLGVYRSIKYPDEFIKEADGDDRGTCSLHDIKDEVTRYYELDGKIWQFDNSTRSLHSLHVTI